LPVNLCREFGKGCPLFLFVADCVGADKNTCGLRLEGRKHSADLKKLSRQAHPIKYHLVTIAILIIALAFYAWGYSGLGGFAFAIGAVFEIWFWVRLFRGS
jgi:hypothetical protein